MDFADRVSASSEKFPDFGRIFQTFSTRANNLHLADGSGKDSEFYFDEIENFTRVLNDIKEPLQEALAEANLQESGMGEGLAALIEKLKAFLAERDAKKIAELLAMLDEELFEAYAKVETKLMKILHAKNLVRGRG